MTYSRIGDAVLSTGILGELIRCNSTIKITIACGPSAAPLFAATPNVVKVISMPKRKASLHWLSLWRECVPTRWDVLVDLRNSLVTRLLSAKAYHFGGRPDPTKHRLESLGTLMKMSPTPSPKLWLGEEHRNAAEELLPSDGPILALGPMANWIGKQWEGQRFAELANRLTGSSGRLQGAHVAILGGQNDGEQSRVVSKLIPHGRCIDLVGKLELLTASAVLHRCHFFIGNDSGLMHIAAASGVPTLGLFGPSREKHYAPWGNHTAVVRTKLSYDELVGGSDYNPVTTRSLMESLSVDAAEDAAVKLWNRTYGVKP